MEHGTRSTILSYGRTAIIVAGCCLLAQATASKDELTTARDKQDSATIDRLISRYGDAAKQNQKSADVQYKLALSYSYGAEVATEMHDKKRAERLAEAGLEAAQKAVNQSESNAEYHRLEGALCGQVIPANPIMGALKYGQCAKDEIDKAIQLDGKLAMAYVSRGVGSYYLPAQMGGGVDPALKDFDKAISLDPNLAEGYLWKGVALHKANRNNEARQALEKSLQLDPDRIWAKDQLNKLPAP